MSVHDIAQTAGPVFTISRLFRAPRLRVWQAWTQPELLAGWFGPKGVTTTVLAMVLRPGGRFHGAMDRPDGGGRMWVLFAYREIAPPERLVWVHSFADADGNVIPAPIIDVWPLELLTTIVFADEGEGTRVTLTQEPLGASEAERQAFAAMMDSMKGGWGGSFDVLDERLAGTAG